MPISRIIIKNFKGLSATDLGFGPGLNILVGDNEAGKSTVLEAVNLCLTGQLKRRDAAYELNPFLFSQSVVEAYVTSLRAGEGPRPPEILIEVYLDDRPEFAEHKGTNNSQALDCPGLKLRIALDEDHFGAEYADYVADPERVATVPVEYYHIEWLDFANQRINSRSKPIKPALIDPSSLTNVFAANRYVLELARDYLSRKEQVDIALSYRHLREVFQSDDKVRTINTALAAKKGEITDRTLSVALDMSARAGWESNVTPHLDDLPISLIGKGEQTAVKIKLALEANEACDLLLIEEPETHQAHGSLSRLIDHVSKRAGDKQLILTTHSSFVLNKLGVDAAIMFNGVTGLRLENLPEGTRKYFMKLPGHDTLRMVLAARSILVEGSSDELMVQRAYAQRHGKPALADGVEIISVGALAFKRYLDIAVALKLDVSVVTDNDGDIEALRTKYSDYHDVPSIHLCYSENEELTTLDPQMVAVNEKALFEAALGRTFKDEEALLKHMKAHKADSALALFEQERDLNFPEYIARAVR